MQFQQPKLQQYLQHPKGQLAIKSIRIGKVEFLDIFVQDRAGALHLQDLVQATYDHSEKLRRLRRNGTRYPEPLPLATPARLLSEEVDDFLKDKERQNSHHHNRCLSPHPGHLATRRRKYLCFAH